MNALIVQLKRFLGNKNTVTILCVVAGIAILYVGYNYRVQSTINPTLVPYAKVAMEARHVIDEKDIGYMEVNSTVISKASNIVKNLKDLVGKEVTYGNRIEAGSLIYKEDITDPKLSPDYVLNDIKDGYTAFSLSVDETTTYGNYIAIGSYIDLFFEGKDDYGKLMYTKFVQSIQVLDVRDSKGISLGNTKSDRPAELLFAVPDELYSLLVKAEEVGNLEPVPRNASYTASPGETQVASSYIREYILSKSAVIPDENISNNNSEE